MIWHLPPQRHECSRSWFGSMVQGDFVPINDRKPPVFYRGDWGWNEAAIWRVEMWEFFYACNLCGRERSAILPCTRTETCPFCNTDGVFKFQRNEITRQFYQYASIPGASIPAVTLSGPRTWLPDSQEIQMVTQFQVYFQCQQCGRADSYPFEKATSNFELPAGFIPGKI